MFSNSASGSAVRSLPCSSSRVRFAVPKKPASMWDRPLSAISTMSRFAMSLSAFPVARRIALSSSLTLVSVSSMWSKALSARPVMSWFVSDRVVSASSPAKSRLATDATGPVLPLPSTKRELSPARC